MQPDSLPLILIAVALFVLVALYSIFGVSAPSGPEIKMHLSINKAPTLPLSKDPLGTNATHEALNFLAQDIPMPDISINGQISVLNAGGGYAIGSLDHVSQACVDWSKAGPPKTILDIGAGYGTISVAILQKTSCSVIANDIGVENLLIIRNRATSEQRERLFLNHNRFPQNLDFPDESLDGIAISQVFHFLTGEEIDAGLLKLFRWLKPGGKLFITTSSPYVKVLTDFMPTYAARKAADMRWPGHIDNWSTMRPHMKNLPLFFHVIDHATLGRALREAEFEVEAESFVDRRETIPSLGLDGREDIGVIAMKPERHILTTSI